MMTQETLTELRVREHELWDKLKAARATADSACKAWSKAQGELEDAQREMAIEAEVQKRLAEQAGKLSEATLSAANIGAALAGGARTLEECK